MGESGEVGGEWGGDGGEWGEMGGKWGVFLGIVECPRLHWVGVHSFSTGRQSQRPPPPPTRSPLFAKLAHF